AVTADCPPQLSNTRSSDPACEIASAISDQIGEAAFGAAEIRDAEPQKEGDDGEAEEEPGRVEPAVAAEHAPAEAVDHADHRVEAVPEAPLLGNDRARKPDRRDVEP